VEQFGARSRPKRVQASSETALEEDKAARAVVFGLLAKMELNRNAELASAGTRASPQLALS
jgi:hypothetical protein